MNFNPTREIDHSVVSSLHGCEYKFGHDTELEESILNDFENGLFKGKNAIVIRDANTKKILSQKEYQKGEFLRKTAFLGTEEPSFKNVILQAEYVNSFKNTMKSIFLPVTLEYLPSKISHTNKALTSVARVFTAIFDLITSPFRIATLYHRFSAEAKKNKEIGDLLNKVNNPTKTIITIHHQYTHNAKAKVQMAYEAFIKNGVLQSLPRAKHQVEYIRNLDRYRLNNAKVSTALFKNTMKNEMKKQLVSFGINHEEYKKANLEKKKSLISSKMNQKMEAKNPENEPGNPRLQQKLQTSYRLLAMNKRSLLGHVDFLNRKY